MVIRMASFNSNERDRKASVLTDHTAPHPAAREGAVGSNRSESAYAGGNRNKGRRALPVVVDVLIILVLIGIGVGAWFGYSLLKEAYAPAAAAAPQPAPQSLRHAGKVYMIDINNRKLSAFDTFELEPVAFAGKGEAAVIGGGQAGQTVRVPVCALYGIGRGFLGLKRRSLLGMYATMEDARKELAAIAEQSGERASYQLRYACRMDGVRVAE
jgi:hypothetical protein